MENLEIIENSLDFCNDEITEAFQAKYAHTTIWDSQTIVHSKGSLEFLSTFGINENQYYTICSKMRP